MTLPRLIYIFAISLLLVGFIHGQNPGLVVQSGLSALYSKDSNITAGGQAHYGWMVGADARLLDGDVYFLLGGQYHFSHINANKSPNFFSNSDWDILMLRAGMGFNLLHLSDRASIRSKLVGSINFNTQAPKNGLGKEGYEQLNDSFLGAVTGLGLTLGYFNVDVDYQYGIINAFYQKSESTFDVITLSVGFHF